MTASNYSKGPIECFSLRLCLCVTIAAALSAIVQGARADDRRLRQPLSLPAQKLVESLQAISERTGVAIAYDRDALANYAGHVVRNAHTAADALSQATDRMGLSVRPDGDGFRVLRTPGHGEPMVLETVRVTATLSEAETSISAGSTVTSTRDGASLREQPQSTTTVTSKLLEDQQVQNITEGLRNVSGVAVLPASTQGPPGFNVRGFLTTPLTNGLTTGSGINQPIAGVERIEVLKGPSAVLSGAYNLGGTVNIVTKRPSADPLMNLSLEAGSYRDLKFTADGSDALNASKTLSGRMIAERQSAKRNFVGADGRNEYLLAPSLRYKNQDTDFIVGLSRSEQFNPTPAFTAVDPDTGRLFDRPRSTVGNPGNGMSTTSMRYYYDFTQHLADWLTLVSRGERARNDRDIVYELPFMVDSVENGFATGDASFFAGSTRQLARSWANDTYLRATFAMGAVSHTVSMGANLSREDAIQFNDANASGPETLNLLDDLSHRPKPWPAAIKSTRSRDDQTGYYLQDFVEYGPLHVLAAVRRNRYVQGSHFYDPSLQSNDVVFTQTAVTPSYGIVYDLTEYFSAYANDMRGFEPGGIDYTGKLFPNVTTRNREVGLKLDMLDKRLALVGSLYRIDQSHVLIYQPDGSYIVTDGQRSQGAEVDLTGYVGPGWSIAATFSHAAYTYIVPSPYVIFSQPQNSYSVFASYEQPSGAWKGFGGSIGLYGFSSSYIDYAGQYRLPAQYSLDANAYARFGPRMHLNFGIKNLTDRKGYGLAGGGAFVPLATPREYRLTFTYSFF